MLFQETMAGREALRGAEVQTVDLIAEDATPEEWAEMLEGPLRALVVGTRRNFNFMLYRVANIWRNSRSMSFRRGNHHRVG